MIRHPLPLLLPFGMLSNSVVQLLLLAALLPALRAVGLAGTQADTDRTTAVAREGDLGPHAVVATHGSLFVAEEGHGVELALITTVVGPDTTSLLCRTKNEET